MKYLILLSLLQLIPIHGEPLFNLLIYEAPGCKYCKFASKQLKTIITENYWDEAIALEIIDCEKKKSECRDSLSSPLLIMQNQNRDKLSEVGGTHSKIFFQDWIENIMKKQAAPVLETNQDQQMIVNGKQMLKMYEAQIAILKKKSEDKRGIFQTTSANSEQAGTVEESYDSAENASPHSQHQDNQIYLIIAVVSLTLLIMYALRRNKSSFKSRKIMNQIRIPEEDQFE